MEHEIREQHEQWHFDKGIPVALILTVFLSVSSGIWYAARTTARIDSLEEKVFLQNTFRDDITVLKIQMQNLTRIIERIETTIERQTGTLQEKFNGVERPQ